MEVLTGHPLFWAPLWVIFVTTVVVSGASLEFGYRIARFMRSRVSQSSEATLRTLVSAELVLLSFVLSFTFQLATTQYTARRQAILADAVAIRSAWLRTTLLPPSSQAGFREQLRKYAEVRFEAERTGDYNEGIRRSEELQHEMWMGASTLEQANPKNPGVAWFLAALNNMVEVHSKRVDPMLQDVFPRLMWFVVYALVIFSMLTVGYHLGTSGARQVVAVATLVLSFSAVLTLIGDLDNPRRGGLRVRQAEMQKLLKEMQ